MPEQLRFVQFDAHETLRASDLQMSEEYHRWLSQAHNLHAHQWGILFGLELEAHGRHLRVSRGAAMDGLGRFLGLAVAQDVPLVNLQDERARNKGALDVWIEHAQREIEPAARKRHGRTPASARRAACAQSPRSESDPIFSPLCRMERFVEEPRLVSSLVPVTSNYAVYVRGRPTTSPGPASPAPVYLGRIEWEVPSGGDEPVWAVKDIGRPYAGLVAHGIVAPNESPSEDANQRARTVTRLQLGPDEDDARKQLLFAVRNETEFESKTPESRQSFLRAAAEEIRNLPAFQDFLRESSPEMAETEDGKKLQRQSRGIDVSLEREASRDAAEAVAKFRTFLPALRPLLAWLSEPLLAEDRIPILKIAKTWAHDIQTGPRPGSLKAARATLLEAWRDDSVKERVKDALKLNDADVDDFSKQLLRRLEDGEKLVCAAHDLTRRLSPEGREDAVDRTHGAPFAITGDGVVRFRGPEVSMRGQLTVANQGGIQFQYAAENRVHLLDKWAIYRVADFESGLDGAVREVNELRMAIPASGPGAQRLVIGASGPDQKFVEILTIEKPGQGAVGLVRVHGNLLVNGGVTKNPIEGGRDVTQLLGGNPDNDEFFQSLLKGYFERAEKHRYLLSALKKMASDPGFVKDALKVLEEKTPKALVNAAAETLAEEHAAEFVKTLVSNNHVPPVAKAIFENKQASDKLFADGDALKSLSKTILGSANATKIIGRAMLEDTDALKLLTGEILANKQAANAIAKAILDDGQAFKELLGDSASTKKLIALILQNGSATDTVLNAIIASDAAMGALTEIASSNVKKFATMVDTILKSLAKAVEQLGTPGGATAAVNVNGTLAPIQSAMNLLP